MSDNARRHLLALAETLELLADRLVPKPRGASYVEVWRFLPCGHMVNLKALESDVCPACVSWATDVEHATAAERRAIFAAIAPAQKRRQQSQRSSREPRASRAA